MPVQVQRQLGTLPEQGFPALLDKLVECMRSAARGFPAATTPLAVALSALVVQWQDWDGGLQTLGERYLPNPLLLDISHSHLSLKALRCRSIHMCPRDEVCWA